MAEALAGYDPGSAAWAGRCDALIEAKKAAAARDLEAYRRRGIAIRIPSAPPSILVFPDALAVRQLITLHTRDGADHAEKHRYYTEYASQLDMLRVLRAHVVLRDEGAIIILMRQDVVDSLLRASPTDQLDIYAKEGETLGMVTGRYPLPEEPDTLMRVRREGGAFPVMSTCTQLSAERRRLLRALLEPMAQVSGEGDRLEVRPVDNRLAPQIRQLIAFATRAPEADLAQLVGKMRETAQ